MAALQVPQIEIIGPGEQTGRFLKLTMPSITVGSDPNNDLVLNDPGVAPTHLYIDARKSPIKVVHIGSQALTIDLSANKRVLLHQPNEWKANHVYQVGSHKLKLHMVAIHDWRQATKQSSLRGFFRNREWSSTFRTFLRRWRGWMEQVGWLLWFALTLLMALALYLWLPNVWASPQPISYHWRNGRGEQRATSAQPVASNNPLQMPQSATATLSTSLPAESLPAESAMITVSTPTPYRTPTLVAFALPAAVNSTVPDQQGSVDSGTIAPRLEPLPAGRPLSDGPPPPKPTLTATPAPTVLRTPTATPTIPPVAVIALEPVLQKLGVWVAPAVVPFGEKYWRLVYAHWLDEDEAAGHNQILVDARDEVGQRINQQPVKLTWKDGNVVALTNKGPEESFALDFGLTASGNAFAVQVEGLPSDSVRGLGMGTTENPLAATKTSFYLIFQRTLRE